MFWLIRGRINTRLKLVHQPINPLTNTHKIVKLCVDVCGYGCGCVNVNMADSVFANDNVAGCVDAYEKIFASIDKAKWLCYNSITK